MRVLVVDQDSTLLTAITRTLGEYFSIDAVTNKADCLDLVRVNDFDVIVAGERLEDGSGLELLGQLARTRPEMLRIFAAERERLKLLKGRLGPFGLFRTLAYPIQPRQLLAALSAASGTEDYAEEAPEAGVEAAPSPTPEAEAQVAPAAEPAARRPAPSGKAASESLRTPENVAVVTWAPFPTPEPVRVAASAHARMPEALTVVSSAPARTPEPVTVTASARAPSQRYRVGSPAGIPATAMNNAQTAQAAPARQTASPGATARARGAAVPGQPRQVPRQPTPTALAAASKLDIVTRPKGYPLPSETSPARSAFLVGAGVILVLGGLALSFKIFNTKDEPVAPATNVSAARSPHFPPEVVKLVADTEVAFQQDNFKTARTDVAALQQIAPDHPRLPFFESLVKRLEATNRDASAKAAAARTLSRSGASSARPSSAPANSSAAAISRRQPDNNRDTASTSGAVTTPVSTATVATFAGRTLEDSSSGTTATQAEATPSQAMATPIPRRPGSAAPLPDTQEARLVQHIAAEYPRDAARKGIEGSVDVSFTVTSQGKVTDVLVLDSEPSEIFNRSAVAAVRRWKYDPKTIGGVPVESHLQLRLQFKLDPRSR
ncbi:MAG: energy transducer TonB [Gammaproteobacteria bacterium]|nr:energy transducer TonB [Gammaproteobacteria bacterium]